MKKNILKIDKKNFIIGLIFLIAGFFLAYFMMLQKVNYQKDLTKKILNNSLQSMTSSKEIADTCSEAYQTATSCVSNLDRCDIEAEAKKLDEFNYKRGQAEEIIDWMNEDMKKIIQEVKSNP